MKRKHLFTIIIFISTIFSIQAQSLDWNVGIGGNFARNGLSWALGPVVESGGEPELYWEGGEYAIAAGLPVIEGDKLVVYRRWSGSQDESWIVCYNVYDGTELWKITLPVDPQADHFAKVSGVYNGQVYATRAGGFYEPSWLYALDIETGEVLWQSEDKVTEYTFETVTFRENGDIIAGNEDEILCISQDDGTTLWELERFTWSADGSSVSAYGNRGYYWDKAPGTIDMVVSVCDLETGDLLYQSDAITTAAMQGQQSNLLVGPNGTVYAPRSNGYDFDSIVSLTDQGDSFKENWRYAIGNINFCSHGVGPDNTVYTYSRDRELVRLDPNTGEVLNTSIVIAPLESFFMPWVAIGDDGMVYLAVEDWPFYKLYIFTPELELQWGEEIYGLRGVALGDSVMAINGKNNIIRAYKGRHNPTADITELPKENNLIAVSPNPSSGIFNILVKQNISNSDAKVDVINISGQTVYSSVISSGFESSFMIDLSEQEDGLYIIRYFAGNKYHFQKIIKQHL